MERWSREQFRLKWSELSNNDVVIVSDLDEIIRPEALKFIKKFNLYKDPDMYVQKANSYVLGYEASKHLRRWFKQSPSYVKKIYTSMPKTFIKIGRAHV